VLVRLKSTIGVASVLGEVDDGLVPGEPDGDDEAGGADVAGDPAGAPQPASAVTSHAASREREASRRQRIPIIVHPSRHQLTASIGLR
jgi:hypothetical protein